MKIACVDNMNHMMFSLVRYLRDAGHDAELVINKGGYDHFHPIADSYDDAYKDYTRVIDRRTLLESPRKLRRRYDRYDFVIGSSYTPCHCEQIGRRLDVFVPHGSDFFSYPLKPFSIKPRQFYVFFIGRMQKRGIEHSRHIHMDFTNPEQERVLSRFRLEGQRNVMPLPSIYLPQYETAQARSFREGSGIVQSMRSIRESNDLVVFHHSSHQWVNPTYSLSQKRNDVLIRGFARFIRANPGYRACLVMVEYGPDVAHSKALVRELNIERHCGWFPISQRKELILGLELADLGAGEFGHSWFSYGTIFEFMSMGVPVMHYRDDNLYKESHPDMYPMFSARNEVDVWRVLENLHRDPVLFKRIGEEARKWFRRFVIDEPLRWYDELLRGKVSTVHERAGLFYLTGNQKEKSFTAPDLPEMEIPKE